MTSIPAVPLMPTAGADHLHQPLLVMAHPRHHQDSRGDGNDAKTQEHHHRSQQPPQFRMGTTSQEPTVVMVTIFQQTTLATVWNWEPGRALSITKMV